MARVALGRYAIPWDRDGSTFLASDAFWDPISNVIAIASSEHHYDLYPIGERDVQAAFRMVRTALAEHSGSGLIGPALLQELLQEVHRGFGKIDIREHIAGLEFRRVPPFPEPSNDPQARPRVQIILLELRGTRLSVACVGRNFSVYALRPTGLESIFGWDGVSKTWAVVEPDPYGAFIWGHLDISGEDEIWETEVRSKGMQADLWEVEMRPGDLLLVTTWLLTRIIHQAKLDEFIKTTGCDPEAISQHLMAMILETTVRPRVFDRTGAAWAIACV